jgi:hypothetical protein
MRTIEEIRAITQNTIKERERKSIEACTKFIEDTIEPNILAKAKNGFTYVYIYENSLSLLQINYIINIYEEKGYKVKYVNSIDTFEIYWNKEE